MNRADAQEDHPPEAHRTTDTRTPPSPHDPRSAALAWNERRGEHGGSSECCTEAHAIARWRLVPPSHAGEGSSEASAAPTAA